MWKYITQPIFHYSIQQEDRSLHILLSLLDTPFDFFGVARFIWYMCLRKILFLQYTWIPLCLLSLCGLLVNSCSTILKECTWTQHPFHCLFRHTYTSDPLDTLLGSQLHSIDTITPGKSCFCKTLWILIVGKVISCGLLQSMADIKRKCRPCGTCWLTIQ